MFKRFSTNYIATLFISDALITQFALWIAMQLRFTLPYGQNVEPQWVPQWVYVPSWRLHFVVGVLWMASFLVLDVYTPRRIVRWVDEFQRILLAHTVAALSLAGLLYLGNVQLLRLTYIYFGTIALLFLLAYRTLLRTWHRLRHGLPSSVARILIIGAGQVGREIVAEFTQQGWPGVEVVGFLDDNPQQENRLVRGIPVLGKISDLLTVMEEKQVDEVLIALPANAHERIVNLITQLQSFPLRIRIAPDYLSLAFFGATVESLGGIPLIGLRDPAITEFQRVVKRVLDICLATAAIVCTIPLFAAVALAIKLEDRGPILYLADRVGENGRLFKMFKFRSMVVNADQLQEQINNVDKNGHVVHKVANDPRVTRVGRFIRQTSIDELPQLFNVLRGDMSMVGPRPEQPWLVALYEPWQRKRLAVPQGITGWWQVNGRSDNLMHLHTDQDIYYIQNYSIWLDIQILWRTVTVVMRGKGAY